MLSSSRFTLISPRFTSFLEVVDGTTETGSIPCSRDRGTPGFERGSCGVKRWWLWGYHSKLWTFQGVTNRGFGKLSTNIFYHQFHIFQKRLLKPSDQKSQFVSISSNRGVFAQRTSSSFPMDFLKEWNSLETRGRLVVALYGIVSLHFWTQRILRRGVSEVNAEANLAIFSKLIGTPTVDEEAQRLLDKRRRISFQEIANVWGYVLDLFLLALFIVQLCGILDPMIHFLPFFFGVAMGSEILRRIADYKDSVTPARLDRDVTVMSILVFVSTLGMPREFMPACYMARTLCFSFTCSRFSNKVNLLVAPLYVFAHWVTQSPDGPPERLEFHIFSEVISVSFMTLLMNNLDTKEHKLAEASVELEVKARQIKEAEREGSAAQRLLSVTCDASVRLTHDLAIQMSSLSLLDLLMCHFGNKSTTSLDGTPFVRYIAAADHQRFLDFIDESSNALAPARSLHIKMKDSSGVAFDAELFHVTVPGLTDQPEHLIGITNESNSTDCLGRMENLCPSSDMRHVLGYGLDVKCPSIPQSRGTPGSRISPSKASSDSSGSDAPRYKELQSLKNIRLIVDDDQENDFVMRQLTFNFTPSSSCSASVLPNLLEWLKPHYRTAVARSIEAASESNEKIVTDFEVKALSPFPGSSLLLSKAMSVKLFEENVEESLFEIELGQLYAR